MSHFSVLVRRTEKWGGWRNYVTILCGIFDWVYTSEIGISPIQIAVLQAPPGGGGRRFQESRRSGRRRPGTAPAAPTLNPNSGYLTAQAILSERARGRAGRPGASLTPGNPAPAVGRGGRDPICYRPTWIPPPVISHRLNSGVGARPGTSTVTV